MHLTPFYCAAFGVVSLTAMCIYFLARGALDTRA